jgi:hypothetical protein
MSDSMWDKTVNLKRTGLKDELEAIKPNEGTKFDAGKPNMALLSPIAITAIAQVMTFGEKKYTSHNWRNGFPWSRVMSATFRHLFAWLSGEDKDPESGLSHLAHAACNICFLLEFEVTKQDKDDRFKLNKKE